MRGLASSVDSVFWQLPAAALACEIDPSVGAADRIPLCMERSALEQSLAFHAKEQRRKRLALGWARHCVGLKIDASLSAGSKQSQMPVAEDQTRGVFGDDPYPMGTCTQASQQGDSRASPELAHTLRCRP